MKRAWGMDPEDFHECKRMGYGSLVESTEAPQGMQLRNPFAVQRSEPADLVELAREIQKADNYVKAVTCAKIQVIADQMRFLQQQAHHILTEARENADLNHVACNFRKVPGHMYHLYERSSGHRYFSMLSPEEWNSPHLYLGSYRLEMDYSWTPASQVDKKNNELALLDKVVNMNDQSKMPSALISITNE